MRTSYPKNILVIDEIPLLSVGLQQVFRSLNPSICVEYTSSLFTALSSRAYNDKNFDLVVLGSGENGYSYELALSVSELKKRFDNTRIMIYTDKYDPDLIGNLSLWSIDACVHKHESFGEIVNAYLRLSAGEIYISEIFHTLYHTYQLDHGSTPDTPDTPGTPNAPDTPASSG